MSANLDLLSPWRSNDVLAVDLNGELVGSLSILRESIVDGVRSVVVVAELVLDNAGRTSDTSAEFLATLSHVLVSLGAGTDGELVVLNKTGVVVSSFLDVDSVRRVGDWGVLQSDLNLVCSCISGCIVNTVSTITVVGNVGGYIAIGALDLDNVGITTRLHWLTISTTRLDVEVGWEIVLYSIFQSRTIDFALGGISTNGDTDFDRGLEVDAHFIASLLSWLVGNSEGTVLVINKLGVQLRTVGSNDLNLEWVGW